jgi:hypothetical protein
MYQTEDLRLPFEFDLADFVVQRAGTTEEEEAEI